MASLMSYGTHGKDSAPWLKATMAVASPFTWNQEILKRKLAAGLARENKYPVLSGTEQDREVFWRVNLTIETITDVNYPRSYLVSWRLEPRKLYSGYDADKLRCMARVILAVFTEMEEKVRATQVIREPLSWLIQTPMVREDAVKACCDGDPCCE